MFFGEIIYCFKFNDYLVTTHKIGPESLGLDLFLVCELVSLFSGERDFA